MNYFIPVTINNIGWWRIQRYNLKIGDWLVLSGILTNEDLGIIWYFDNVRFQETSHLTIPKTNTK